MGNRTSSMACKWSEKVDARSDHSRSGQQLQVRLVTTWRVEFAHNRRALSACCGSDFQNGTIRTSIGIVGCLRASTCPSSLFLPGCPTNTLLPRLCFGYIRAGQVMDCDWRYTSTCSHWAGRRGSGNSSEILAEFFAQRQSAVVLRQCRRSKAET